MLQFRSFKDLNTSIMAALPKLPRNFDLIVGIPRSGMLVANILALHMNIPFTDLEGLLDRRVIMKGRREIRGYPIEKLFDKHIKVLVVDDSVGRGTQMRAAREKIADAKLPHEILYGAVYVTPESLPLVDFAFERIDWGHCFAWNVMHHKLLSDCCVDIDGVICVDPDEREDDDGDEYLKFLVNTKPLFLPKVEIGWLVTGRLEKYRPQTADWLERHGVRYRELLMMDLPDTEAKRKIGGGAPFKSQVYLKTNAALFIESDLREARVIAKRAGQPVLCIPIQEMIYPEFTDRLTRRFHRVPISILRRLRGKFSEIYRRRQNKEYLSSKF
jgi:orotate phosphoribosyltransferase